jgi:chemotaxis response regulator CheB
MNPVGTNYPLPFWNRPNKLVTIAVTRLEWSPVFVNNMPVMDGITGKQVMEMQQVPVMETSHIDKHGARHERPKLITCMAYVPRPSIPLQWDAIKKYETHQSQQILSYPSNRLYQHALRMARQEKRTLVTVFGQVVNEPVRRKPTRRKSKAQVAKSTVLR